jgi:hypothetical protein
MKSRVILINETSVTWRASSQDDGHVLPVLAFEPAASGKRRLRPD